MQLSADKTEILITGHDSANVQISNRLGSLSDSITSHCRNLGVIFFNQTLSLNKHVNSVVQSSFHHLRNISGIRLFLSNKHLETVIHAFISHLDYSSSLFSGINEKKASRTSSSGSRLIHKGDRFFESCNTYDNRDFNCFIIVCFTVLRIFCFL